MRRVFIFTALLLFLTIPVSAMSFEAPEVPESGREIMPDSPETFSEGLLKIVRKGISVLQPDLAEASRVCLKIFAAVLLMSLLKNYSGTSKRMADVVGALLIGGMLLSSSHSLIQLGVHTIMEISEYGKLLLPVMTAAMAAQGGITSSAALYGGTAFFNMILSTVIASFLTPLIYIYLALSVANSALGEDLLKKMRDLVKWFSIWCLRSILYIFTGYMGITGVVSGTTDAAALKVTKMTISGIVPVVGGILSDASEAVLVGAGTMKNAAGIYGMLAMIAVWIGPFLKIGIQYLILKLTAAICSVFDNKRTSELVQDFSGAMGLICGMTGSMCLLLLISTVCFLKGVG